jgi:hypothetical protein
MSQFSRISLLSILASMAFTQSCLSETPCVYVSPTGSDESPGSNDKPFATLERAKQEARKLKKDGGATVCVAPGVYRMTKTLALGREDSGIVYSGGPGVVLSGSREVPASVWLPALQSTNAHRLNPSVSSKIVVLDLVKNGFQKPASLRPNFGMPFNQPELFCNGKRMTLSQWPNQGWSTIEKIISSGTVPSSGSASDASKPSRVEHNRRGLAPGLLVLRLDGRGNPGRIYRCREKTDRIKDSPYLRRTQGQPLPASLARTQSD